LIGVSFNGSAMRRDGVDIWFVWLQVRLPLFTRFDCPAHRASKNRAAQTSGAAHHREPESPLSLTTREGTKIESSEAGKDNNPVQEEESPPLYQRTGLLSKKFSGSANFRLQRAASDESKFTDCGLNRRGVSSRSPRRLSLGLGRVGVKGNYALDVSERRWWRALCFVW